MSTPTDQYETSTIQPGPFSSWVKNVISHARHLIGFFDLTEEDQTKADIYPGYGK
jgi:hypothetical protein